MSRMYDKQVCPNCGTMNLVDLGDMDDLTTPDVEVCKCCKCRSRFIVLDDDAIAAKADEEGEDVLQLRLDMLNHGYGYSGTRVT